jgi:hypothetical protein
VFNTSGWSNMVPKTPDHCINWKVLVFQIYLFILTLSSSTLCWISPTEGKISTTLGRSHPLPAQFTWLIHSGQALIHIRIDFIIPRIDRIRTWLDLTHTQLEHIPTFLDLSQCRLDLIHSQLDLSTFG